MNSQVPAQRISSRTKNARTVFDPKRTPAMLTGKHINREGRPLVVEEAMMATATCLRSTNPMSLTWVSLRCMRISKEEWRTKEV